MNKLDKYDHMILDIIHMHKIENQCHIRLAVLERNFWKRIEEDTDLPLEKLGSESASPTCTSMASFRTKTVTR